MSCYGTTSIEHNNPNLDNCRRLSIRFVAEIGQMAYMRRLRRTRLLSLEAISLSLLLVFLVYMINITFMSHHLSHVDHNLLGNQLHAGGDTWPAVTISVPAADSHLLQAIATTTPSLKLPKKVQTKTGSSPYAYAFVMGAIHEDRAAYKGFLYDVLVSASVLKKYGSTADVWLWTQLSPDSELDELPEEDMRLLRALNIHVKQLQKPMKESFAHIVYEKFRPLQMTQYRRVMFLDADTMPLLNLDYLFHLSDPQLAGKQSSIDFLRPNLIMASKGEPCNAGMFIVAPEEGGWDRVQEAIAAQREMAKNLPYPHFDWDIGWGHNFSAEGDQWKSIDKYGVRWRFHAGHSDQGLLYYYLKYIKQDVSIVIGSRIENWIPGQFGKPELSEELPNTVNELTPKPVEPMYNCGVPDALQDETFWHMCYPVYRDFAHFMGKNKPWQVGVNPPWGPKDCGKTFAPYRVWWKELAELNLKYEMGLDVTNWDEVHLPQMKDSPLGYIASFKDHVKEVPDSTILEVERVCLPKAPQVNRTEDLPLAAYLADLKADIHQKSLPIPSEQAKYAYAFLVHEIHEENSMYKGSLYSVLVAVNALRKFGSTADFWIYTKRSHQSELKKLPAEDRRLLTAMNIHIDQLEDHKDTSFKHIIYEKLRVVEMTQYRRVMFLGTETMPLVNLDYLFHLSDPELAPKDFTSPVLRPNLVMASKGEPLNAAMFILQPETGALALLRQILDDQMEAGIFSEGSGWGHDFLAIGDRWESIEKSGNTWWFQSAHSEQGLLYYYLKYVKKDVSIVIGDRIQNWVAGNTAMPKMEKEIPHGRDAHFPVPKLTQYNCGILDRKQDTDYQHMCLPIYRDFAYFNSADKPWQIGRHPKFGPKDCQKWHAPYRLWFKELRELDKQYNMTLDIENWDTVHLPQLKGVPGAQLPVKANSHPLAELPLVSYLAEYRKIGNQTATSAPDEAKYAYSFVMGGIHEDRPAYKGFLYDVLIAASLLRKYGSTADIWLWIQLSPDSTMDDLPTEDLRLLHEMKVRVKLLEKPKHESFAHIVYEKFRPLQMTQYRRVMFLDADAIPLVNLDYLFHLSDPQYAPDLLSPVLRPNLILSSRGEPCNAGMFILQPEEGAWERLQEVVAAQREEAKDLPYPHFDWEMGWGHNFTAEGDEWESIGLTGERWRFHAGHSDQGLLFYYLKYFRQDVSIVIGDRIQNWIPGADGKPHKLVEFPHELNEEVFPKPSAVQYNCLGDYDCAFPDRKMDEEFGHMCLPIYRDFAHFMGTNKPWQIGVHPSWGSKDCHKLYGPYRLWFRELRAINEKLDIGLDVEHYDDVHLPRMKESPLGYLAQFKDHALQIPGSAGKPVHSDGVLINDVSALEKSVGRSDKKKRDNFTVAYAVSFIKCGDFQTHSAGLTDASLILRHSVHKISKRNLESGSKYDYKMYAIVHRQAEECSRILQQTGFEVLVVDPPVKQQEILGNHLRKTIHRERCCGADEFIKLYAYKLPEELIVHVDIDFAFFKPMDDLYDAMLHTKDSPEGRAARSRIQLERPNDKWPDEIGAYITRDWPQVSPGKFPPGYQAGFIVTRRDPTIFAELIDIIKEGNYTDGWGWDVGWGGKGYGGYVGAMAMQGLVAYYYDYIRPNTAVELNHCRHNHMGMDVRARGRCRNGLADCEDCMITDVDKIYSVHYTMCRKPWQCQATGASGGKKPGGERASALNTNTVNLEHCLDLVHKWHTLRQDFEKQLYSLTKDEAIKNGTIGNYRPDVFGGHCQGDGNSEYLLLSGSNETFYRIAELYI